MFLVLDNLGNFDIVKSSFDKLVQNVDSANSIGRLQAFYNDFYGTLIADENFETKFIESEESVWKIYCFTELFQRAVIYSTSFFESFVKILIKFFPFY